MLVPLWVLECVGIVGVLLCVEGGGGSLVCVCSYGVWVLVFCMCVRFCGKVPYAFGCLGRV